MTPPSVTSTQGFTLVEIIVALAVLSMIGIAVASTLSSTTRAVSRADLNAARNADQRVANDYLRRQIALAVPRSTRKRGRSQLWFEGETASVQWLAELPVHAAGGGLRALRLRLDDGNLELDYVLWTAQFEQFEEVWEASGRRSITVLERVEDMRYAYLARRPQSGDAGARWLATWSNREEMPVAVRIAIVKEDGERYAPIEVRLRAIGRTRSGAPSSAAGISLPTAETDPSENAQNTEGTPAREPNDDDEDNKIR